VILSIFYRDFLTALLITNARKVATLFSHCIEFTQVLACDVLSTYAALRFYAVHTDIDVVSTGIDCCRYICYLSLNTVVDKLLVT